MVKYDKFRFFILQTTIKSSFSNANITFFHKSFAISLKSTTFAPSFYYCRTEF